jgi:branched-chain amino acid transport system permease protein
MTVKCEECLELNRLFLGRSSVPSEPQRHLAARDRWRPIELAFWLATLLPFVLVPTYLTLASQIAITAAFAVSLDLIMGYAGLVSLGHAAYFGLGAYSAGLIAKAGWGEPFSGLLIAGAASGVFGWLTAFVVVRVRHLALIMITLGINLLLYEIANREDWLTGGNDGLQGVVIWPLFGHFDFDLYGYTAYAYALAVLLLVVLAARRVVHSPLGLSLRAIRENERRMPAIGAPSRARLRLVYTIAATIAGIAGGLLAQTTQFVSLGALSFERSAELVTILVIGGSGRLYGGIVGAIVYLVARDRLSGINPQYWYFWIGIMLIGIVLFLPNGILGSLATLRLRREGDGRAP